MKYFSFLILFVFYINLPGQINPGINLSNMDLSQSPGNDFYSYCNGTWQKNFQLPESDARYGSFTEIQNANLKRIKKIYEEASTSKSAVANSDLQRLRDFYNTAMDTEKVEAMRFEPIAAQLESINKIKNIDDLIQLKSEFDYLGIDLFFNIGVSPDLKNSKKNAFYISQGGYGLGDRDFYHEDRFESIRKSYVDYLSSLFNLAHIPSEQSSHYANEVLDFERVLTNKAFTKVQMRDVEKLYNIYSPLQLQELVPSINWTKYFQSKNIKQPDTLILGMVDYLKQLDVFLKSAPLDVLKFYARAHLLMASAPYLSTKFQLVHFNFRGAVMSGTKQMKPRWERVHNAMNGSIGEMLSQIYVKKYFSAESKIKVNKLIDNLVLAYRERISTRTWMSQETKNQAYKKLDLMIRKVAYPEKWKTYKGLVISTQSYWDNICRANKWQAQDNLNDLKKPVDRKKWQMTPVTVNAYYDPTTNEITFPAAILQSPFYDPKADDAANYGTLGSIIGHELTHGFDDQGARFDAAGNLKMWWTDSDFNNFKDRTKVIVNQFNNYTALDTLHVNGEMTQGENIADLGGLTMSYNAYQKSLAGQKSKVIGNFTGEQRFFIAWTQGWKSKVRDEELRRLLTVDYHAPAYFRSFAPLTNMQEFYKAFDIKSGDKLFVPVDKRVEIW